MVSNPPQLPENDQSKIHDAAGKDGLSVIRRILSNFHEHSHEKSVLYLFIFDFLFEKVVEISQKIAFLARLWSTIIDLLGRGVRRKS